MAIVINGSGTVTGLAVGGLPDGTVDAGTVAADVATQAEIDAKLNLAGGTMTGEVRIANSSATSQLYLYGAANQKANIILNQYGVRAWHIGSGTLASGQLSISDGTTERMRFQHGGVVSIPSGIELGSGVDGTAANTLDDYEKGVHECAITMGSGTATLHSTNRYLRYVKIGDQVTVSGQINISAVSSPSGTFKISLPFTNSGAEADFSVGNYRSYAVDTPGDGVQAVIFSERGTAKASLQWSRDSAISTNENATNGGYYMIGLTYFTT